MSHTTVLPVPTSELSTGDLTGLRRLVDAAFGPRFTHHDWAHALGGTHFVVRDEEGVILSHASVVERTLEVGGEPTPAGYVEAVATSPEHQGRGMATAVMNAVGPFIAERYSLGALSTNLRFYERFGWLPWRGPTWCRGATGLVRTPEDDGGVWVLPVPGGIDLHRDGDIVADWRPGDVW